MHNCHSLSQGLFFSVACKPRPKEAQLGALGSMPSAFPHCQMSLLHRQPTPGVALEHTAPAVQLSPGK
jgi:hypothetical protein